MDKYEELQTLINDSKKHNLVIKDIRAKNYFDIGGFPHYETAVSNILSFFLDTREDHGFGDLWLKSLIEAYNEKASNKSNLSIYQTKDIRTEYSNGSSKRIDLLIDCDKEVMVIENKIYAKLYNDLEMYETMTENYISGEKDKIIGPKIVLSIFDIKGFDDKCGFVNVTYEEFLKKIENNRPNYQPLEKWDIFAKEFIDNLKNLKGRVGDMDFDKEWLELAKNNGGQIEKLLTVYNNDLDKRLALISKINELCEEKGLEQRHGVYHGSQTDKYFSQYINFQLSDVSPTIETYIMKIPTKKEYEDYDVLYVSIWTRRNKNYAHFDRLLKALNKEDAKERVTKEKYSWGRHYILEELKITDDIDLDALAERIIKYTNAIKTLE